MLVLFLFCVEKVNSDNLNNEMKISREKLELLLMGKIV